jgi:hypothetical protein
MATTIKKRPRNDFPSLCKQLGASNSASVLTERGQTIFQFIRFCSNKIDAGAQAVRTQRWPLTAKIKHPIGASGEGKSMLSTRTVARLGILAVGLGIAGAVASATWIAAADSSTDWLSSLDTLLSGGAAPAADTTDLAISVDGITILQEGSAHAYSGTNGDFAIADGAGTTATAYGTGDYAYAEGTDPAATAGGTTATSGGDGTFDSAFVYGDGSTAFSGGTVADPGTFDSAIVIGNGDAATPVAIWRVLAVTTSPTSKVTI